jgi:molybdate transport system substrate-binding protein
LKTVLRRLLLFLLAACLVIPSAYAGPEQSRSAERVTVFAAASLKDALDEIAREYQREPGVKVVASLAASSALARQIENGAPADVFISADREWMDYLAVRKLIDPATRFDLLSNRLVLIAPKESRIEVELRPGFPLAQLLGGERLAIANPEYVPAGRYARAALQSLKVWDSVQDRLARADNVRVALAFVSRGEAPLGIVYLSDALAEPKVRIVGEFPPDSHPPIIYPVAVVSSSRNSAALDFARYLRSEKARKIFERHGFSAPL